MIILQFNKPSLAIDINEVESIDAHSASLMSIKLKSGEHILAYHLKFT